MLCWREDERKALHLCRSEAWRQMGQASRRRPQFLLANNRNLWPQEAQTHRNCIQILERTYPDLVILNFCPRLQMVVTSPRRHESFLNQPSLSQQSRLLVSVGLWWRGNFSCHTEHQPQPIWVLSLTSCIPLWPQSGGFQHDYKQCHKVNWLKMSSEICHGFPSHCKGIQ